MGKVPKGPYVPLTSSLSTEDTLALEEPRPGENQEVIPVPLPYSIHCQHVVCTLSHPKTPYCSLFNRPYHTPVSHEEELLQCTTEPCKFLNCTWDQDSIGAQLGSGSTVL